MLPGRHFVSSFDQESDFHVLIVQGASLRRWGVPFLALLCMLGRGPEILTMSREVGGCPGSVLTSWCFGPPWPGGFWMLKPHVGGSRPQRGGGPPGPAPGSVRFLGAGEAGAAPPSLLQGLELPGPSALLSEIRQDAEELFNLTLPGHHGEGGERSRASYWSSGASPRRSATLLP